MKTTKIFLIQRATISKNFTKIHPQLLPQNPPMPS